MERGRTNFITESENGLIAIENIEADICKKNGSTSGNGRTRSARSRRGWERIQLSKLVEIKGNQSKPPCP